MRDLDQRGLAKVVFRPVPLGAEEFVFIDMTQPIRAVYFPIAYETEKQFPNLCPYLMVDFRMKDYNSLYRPVNGINTSKRFALDYTWGLGYAEH